MSKKRQPARFDPVGASGALVTTFRHDYPDGFVFDEHYHDRDQIVYASQGVMTVETSQGMWVLPASRALWIPTGVNISPLLKELIIYSCQFKVLDNRTKIRSHLVTLILDLLRLSRTIPLQLPRPVDHRAQRVADFLYANPGSIVPTEEICARAGASKRTIERLFRQNTRMTLGRWRQQLRLMHSMRLLAQGMKINSVALEAGYSSPSAFILMFRSALGTSPGQYFQQVQSHHLE